MTRPAHLLTYSYDVTATRFGGTMMNDGQTNFDLYDRGGGMQVAAGGMDLSWRFSLKMCIYWFRGDMMGGT